VLGSLKLIIKKFELTLILNGISYFLQPSNYYPELDGNLLNFHPIQHLIRATKPSSASTNAATALNTFRHNKLNLDLIFQTCH